jgi:chaperonin GroEL
MGAMFLRHVLWELQDSVGDGTAAAARIFQTIYNQVVRYTVSGGNAMRVRHFMEQLLPPIFAEIDGMITPIRGKEKLTGLAYTISGDMQLSKMMGEIFDIIGEYGRLEIRSGRTRELEREYVEGVYWDSGLFSREMMNDLAEVRAQVEDPAVLATDMDIQNPEDLVPLLDLAVKNGIQKLLLTAAGISDRALSILLSKPNREKVEVVAVKAPGLALDVRTAAARDIALLTGGIPLLDAAGEKITSDSLANLGHTRRAWARWISSASWAASATRACCASTSPGCAPPITALRIRTTAKSCWIA